MIKTRGGTWGRATLAATVAKIGATTRGDLQTPLLPPSGTQHRPAPLPLARAAESGAKVERCRKSLAISRWCSRLNLVIGAT